MYDRRIIKILAILPNTKNNSQICPRFLKLCQSGEILQNLVTLRGDKKPS